MLNRNHLSIVAIVAALSTISCKRELQIDHPTPIAAAANNINAGQPPNNPVETGIVTTFIIGQPHYSNGKMAVDAAGNLYVSDSSFINKYTPDGAVTVFAGTRVRGFQEGPRLTAQFDHPTGLAFDKNGNLLVTDQYNDRVRIITNDGNVSTYAGSGVNGFADGPGTVAKFNRPRGIAVDNAGTVYIADYGNNMIRRISAAGVVTRWVGSGVAGIQDGAGALAQFNAPEDIAVSPNGVCYVSDYYSSCVRKIVSGVVTTFAGSPGVNSFANGLGTAAKFRDILGMATDAVGNIYVSDRGNNRIRKITAAGLVTTLAGDGSNSSRDGFGVYAELTGPCSIVVGPAGTVYIGESANAGIRKMTVAPAVATYAGTGGAGYVNGADTVAQINQPLGVTMDAAGNIYTMDGDARVRKINPQGNVSFLAGSGHTGFADGQGAAASFGSSCNMTVDAGGNIFVADKFNNRIRKITPGGLVSTYAGNGAYGEDTGAISGAVLAFPTDLSFDASGNLLVAQGSQRSLRKITPDGRIGNLTPLIFWSGTTTIFDFMTIDAQGNIYATGTFEQFVYKITPAGVATIFMDQSKVGSWSPRGITVDRSTGNLYVFDAQSHIVRIFSSAGVTLGAIGQSNPPTYGVDGPETFATLSNGGGMTTGADGRIYIADQNTDRIRMFSRR